MFVQRYAYLFNTLYGYGTILNRAYASAVTFMETGNLSVIPSSGKYTAEHRRRNYNDSKS